MEPNPTEQETMYDTIRVKYQNSPVTVVTLGALEKFMVQGTTYGPLESGREFEVPRWVAEVLVSQNKARFKDLGIELPELQKALWRETGEPNLQPLPPNFYFQVKQHITHLARENQHTPNETRRSTQRKMEQLLRDLITNRMLKLMKIALREERLQKIKKKMTEEEQWLIDRLVHLLRNWQKDSLELETHD